MSGCPVLDAEIGDFLEIPEISGEQKGVLGDRDVDHLRFAFVLRARGFWLSRHRRPCKIAQRRVRRRARQAGFVVIAPPYPKLAQYHPDLKKLAPKKVKYRAQ